MIDSMNGWMDGWMDDDASKVSKQLPPYCTVLYHHGAFVVRCPSSACACRLKAGY